VVTVSARPVCGNVYERYDVRLSVCLSHLSTAGGRCGRWVCCGGTAHSSTAALSSKREQCHVDSRRTKLRVGVRVTLAKRLPRRRLRVKLSSYCNTTATSELSTNRVDPWVGMGRVGSRFFSFWWVGRRQEGQPACKTLRGGVLAWSSASVAK